MPKRGPASRQQQAFESLLDQDYAAYNSASEDRAPRQRQGGRNRQPIVDKRASGRTPGFALRESLPLSPRLCERQEQLNSMFGSIFDGSIISEVLAKCDNSVEAATDALLDLSERVRSQEAHAQATPPTGMDGASFQTPHKAKKICMACLHTS